MYPNTFEEACIITGENPNDEKFTTGTADEISYKKLKVTTQAINREDNNGKEWEGDWQDNDEYKWYGWWDLEKDKNNPSGFRFLGSGCGRTGSLTPARLCYKTDRGLKHSADKFLSDWRMYIKGN
jgi:hypothetical protein